MSIKEKFMERFKAKEEVGEGEDFVEVGPTEEGGKISVRVESLKDYADIEKVQSLVREGNVIFLKIRDLREKDMSELKRAVEKLKKTCTAMNGDMVGVDEDFLVITPKFAKIYRGKAG
jgi:SepF-like predicted cell division protein (DUF552 family)